MMNRSVFSKHLFVLALSALVVTGQACLKPSLKGKSSKTSTLSLPTNGIAVTANPIVIGAFTVTVTLGSPMTGLTLADFSITNGTPSAFTSVNSTTYTFTVTPVAVGVMTISVPAGAAAVASSGVASLASNVLSVDYDPSCTVSFTTTGSTFNGNIITTGGTTTWNMNGAITSGTNVMAQNWGVPGTRSNSVRVDTGVNFTQITNWISQNITAISFSLGCNGLSLVEIRYNAITSLDVTMLSALSILRIGNAGGGAPANQSRISSFDFSQNPLLTDVELDYCNMSSLDFHLNPLMTSIRAAYSGTLSSINVNGLTALSTLELTGGLLSSIDVSTNTGLTYLGVSFNNLSSLNVTNNPNLVNLRAASNYLTSLNIANNTLLQGLYLGNMGSGAPACTNTISSIDFTTNNQIRWVELDCNTLSTIDLSGKTTLLTLQAGSMPNLTTVNISGASSVTNVAISYSPVSTLTLGGNTALTSLSVVGNANLGSLNTAAAPALTSLNVSGANLTSITVTGNPALQTLIIGSVGMGALNNNAISAINLTGNPNLVYFRFDGNPIVTLDVSGKTALTDVQGYPSYSLTSINTTGATALKNLILYGAPIAAPNLTTNTALETLALDYNSSIASLNVTANTALKVLTLTATTSLTTLNISNLTQLNTLVANSSALTTLTMANNTALNNMNFQTNSGGMNSLVAAVYAQRAVMPAGSTMTLTGSGVPAGVTLTDINDLIATYSWTIPHD